MSGPPLEGEALTTERDAAMLQQWYDAEQQLFVAFHRASMLWERLDRQAVEEQLLQDAIGN